MTGAEASSPDQMKWSVTEDFSGGLAETWSSIWVCYFYLDRLL